MTAIPASSVAIKTMADPAEFVPDWEREAA